MLEDECRHAQVEVVAGVTIHEVSKPDEFNVRTSKEEFEAASLVVATGGLSIPKAGATSFGYDLARKFGLKIVDPRPALVPFVLKSEDRKRWCDLAGVATEVVASADHQQFREKMLITHRGLSGPAILQASSYWRKNTAISIDLLPEADVTTRLKDAKRDIHGLRSILREVLPNRLAERWAELHAPAQWSNAAIQEFTRAMHHWQIVPEDTEGYGKAEVTAGGVDTDELLAKTMESKKVRGLFFIGEVVDVTGHLGGFNFQWAWASGYCAGQAV
jgi:predicted Rossmann fold flavoprotein